MGVKTELTVRTEGHCEAVNQKDLCDQLNAFKVNYWNHKNSVGLCLKDLLATCCQKKLRVACISFPQHLSDLQVYTYQCMTKAISTDVISGHKYIC